MISEVAAEPFQSLRHEITVQFIQVSVGGVSIRFTSTDSAAIPLIPPLEQFRVETGVPDIAIQVEWLGELPMNSARQLFDSGYTWRLHDEGFSGLRFDFYAPAFGSLPYKRLLINSLFSQGTLQMNETAFAGMTRVPSPLEYPLDELLIMHRLTQEKAIELHGCGIVRANGEGNLFVGHSGAGKSTTTRLWTSRHDVEVLSDDRIIVREHLGQMFMYGTPWHGEAAYASPASAPLSRICILEHGRGNVLTRLTKSQAVAELFARSFVPFHRHEYLESAIEFLQDIVDAVPVYRYAFEPDQSAVDTIVSLHD
jgi:hypothetical protein